MGHDENVKKNNKLLYIKKMLTIENVKSCKIMHGLYNLSE